MSEPKGPFDAAISVLKNRLANRGPGSERNELEQAIRVLKDWPKWGPLIEAAGLVKDKTLAIQWFFQARSDFYFPYVKKQIRILLEALPDESDEEKEREREAYLRNMDEPGSKEEERK